MVSTGSLLRPDVRWLDFASARAIGIQPFMGMCGTMISDVHKADEQPGARSQLVAAQAELEIELKQPMKSDYSDFCIAYIFHIIPYYSISIPIFSYH